MSPTVEDARCNEVLDRLEAFIDEQVDDAESAAIERHLECCDTCARELEHALETVAALRALPELEVPPRVMESTRTAIEVHDPAAGAAPRNRLRGRWLAAAAAIVIGILGTVSVVRDQTEPTGAEALRAAADVQLALATIRDISLRANQMVQARVIQEGAIPQSIRGFARSLEPLTSLELTDGPLAAPFEPTREGSS